MVKTLSRIPKKKDELTEEFHQTPMKGNVIILFVYSYTSHFQEQ